jgi:outer membrane protein
VLKLTCDLLVVRSNYNAATAAAFVPRARVLAAMGAIEQGYLLPEARRADSSQAHFA